MAFLIDSDIMVDFTRGNSKAADYLDCLGADCFLSGITALELIAGARTQREVADLDIMISAYQQIPPNDDITRCAYYMMKDACQIGRATHAGCADRSDSARGRPHARHEESKAFPDDQRAKTGSAGVLSW